MKMIRYEIIGKTGVYNSETDTVEQVERIFTVMTPWSQENEQRVACEAYNGEYTIEDDGQEETEATLEDRVGNLETDSTEMKEALEMILNGVTE